MTEPIIPPSTTPTPIKWWMLAVALVGLLFMPLPTGGRLLHNVADLAHGPLFAGAAAWLFTALCRRTTLAAPAAAAVCWGTLTGFGCVVEMLQPLVGRHASITDIWANACGALAGILWAYGRSVAMSRWRFAIRAAGCGMLVLSMLYPLRFLTDAALQVYEMPSLASFERSSELAHWAWQESRVKRTRQHVTDGSWALRIDMQPGVYPGVEMVPAANWSSYRELTIDVHLDGGPALPLVVKITDAQHNFEYDDRFHHTARLNPGEHQIRIPLVDITFGPKSRRLDLRHVATLSLFTVDLQVQRTITIDRIRLE